MYVGPCDPSKIFKFSACSKIWMCHSFFILIFYLYLGDDSGKVTIWNMAPVKNEEDEMNENVPKLLCQMDNHLGIEHSLQLVN